MSEDDHKDDVEHDDEDNIEMDDVDTSADDENDDDGDENESAPEGEKKKKYVPPTEEEYAKIMRAQEKANKEAEKYRKRAQRLRKERAEQLKAGDDDAADETAAKLEQLAKQADKWRERAVNGFATEALVEAGAKAKSIRRLVRLLKVDDLNLDDDDEDVRDAIDEQIKDLQEDFPEFFKDDDDEVAVVAPRTQRRRSSVDAGAGASNKVVKKPKDDAEIHARRLGFM